MLQNPSGQAGPKGRRAILNPAKIEAPRNAGLFFAFSGCLRYSSCYISEKPKGFFI
jgi:hypothetical protein